MCSVLCREGWRGWFCGLGLMVVVVRVVDVESQESCVSLPGSQQVGDVASPMSVRTAGQQPRRGRLRHSQTTISIRL